jgi:hypothetical protein
MELGTREQKAQLEREYQSQQAQILERSAAVTKAESALAAERAALVVQTKAIKDEFESAMEKIKKQWGNVDDVQADFEEVVKQKLTYKVPLLLEKNDALLHSKLRFIASQREELQRKIDTEAATERERHGKVLSSELAVLSGEEEDELSVLEANWQLKVQPVYDELARLCEAPEAKGGNAAAK